MYIASSPSYDGRMSAHQTYLEAPYAARDAQAAAFERWCEDNDRDYDDPDAEADFEQFCEDWYEDAQLDAYENRLDR